MTTTMEDCDNENKEEEDAVTPCHRPIPTMLWMEIPASFTTTAIQTNSNQYCITHYSSFYLLVYFNFAVGVLGNLLSFHFSVEIHSHTLRFFEVSA